MLSVTSALGVGMLIRPLSLLDFFVAVVMFSIDLRVSGGELLSVRLSPRRLLTNCILIDSIGHRSYARN